MLNYVIIGVVVVLAILLCFGLAIASFAGENYFDMLRKTQTMRNSYGIATMDFVAQINQNYFGGRLKLARCAPNDDHYGSGIVALSSETMSSNSLASLATVAHELGHARQDAEGDTLKKHFALRRTGRAVGFFFMPMVIAGIVLSLLYFFGVLQGLVFLYLGLGCSAVAVLIFMFSIILKYKEIKIEKEASTFALDYLREYLLEPEVKLCREFLDSARLTYWSVLFKTLLGWTFLTKKDRMFY